MKKGIFLFALTTSLFLASCNNDDNDKNFVQANGLIGKWVPVKIGELDNQNMLHYTTYVNDAACDTDNMIFNEDLSYTANDYSDNAGTCETQTENGTYTLQGTALQLSHMDETQTPAVAVKQDYTVTKLSYDSMEVSYTDPSTHKITFVTLNKVN